MQFALFTEQDEVTGRAAQLAPLPWQRLEGGRPESVFAVVDEVDTSTLSMNPLPFASQFVL